MSDTPLGSEALLTKAGPSPTPAQASTLTHPFSDGADFGTTPKPPSDAGAASYKKYGLAVAAFGVLAVTFWLYAKPDVVIMLAEQMWSCF